MTQPHHSAPALAAILVLSGCGQSCRNDKPFVPYTIDPSASPSAPATALPAPSTSGSADPLANPPGQRFPVVKARQLKAGTKQLSAAGGTFAAPAGFTFELAHEADLDGDGAPEAIAWLRSDDGTAGQLMKFVAPAGKPAPGPQTLTSLPAVFAGAPRCNLESELTQIGPHTMLMSTRKACSSDGQPARASRWWSVVVPSRSPSERVSLTMLEQRSAEKAELQFDALDRDGDQFDDVLVTVSVVGTEPGFEEERAPAISAELSFFDRPAGLSRDPHEPAASFRAMADRLAKQIRSKKARGTIAASARRVRELFRSLCSEGGALSIEVGGAPLQCGAGDVLDRVDRAELDAALQGGDVFRALGLFERIVQAAGGQPEKVPDDVRTAVVQACEVVDADAYHLPFAPESGATLPAWGGLAFDAGGALLIRTSSNVMRFDPKTRVALADEPSGAVPPWQREVQSPDGSMLLEGVRDPCDGGPLRMTIRGGSGLVDIPLPVDGVQGRACTKGVAVPVASLRVGAWSPAGLELMVDGVPLAMSADGKKVRAGRVPAQPGHRGGARSAEGTALAMATVLGVAMVPDLAKVELWRVKGEPGVHTRFRDCVVSGGGAAMACIDGTRTRVLLDPRKK